MRPRIAGLGLLGLLAMGRLYAADPASDASRAELSRERKRLVFDLRALADVTRRLETSLSQLSSAARAVTEATSRADAGPEDVARREDAVSLAEQEARALLDRRRILADRVVERRRTIAALESDLSGKKSADLLSGRWSVIVDPGEQKGVFQMSLDGTIVSGNYTLEGGYAGSLRGTLINDRLRLERVDSRLGFSTVFYGRLNRENAVLSGTWEATTFGQGAPGSGSWRAVRDDEKEETP